MSETTNKARALLAAATPGPWSWVCFHDHEDGQAIGVDVASGSGKVCTVDGRELAIDDSRLIAAAPILIATLCDEADTAEDLYRSIKVRLGQAPGDGQLPHAAIDALERRAVEAEAAAAAMRGCVERLNELASDGIQSSGPLANLHPAILASMSGRCEHALSTDASRALLDRLERAETERDALRAERDEMAARVRRLEGRKAVLCTRCLANPGVYGCGHCRNSGAVIVEGDK